MKVFDGNMYFRSMGTTFVFFFLSFLLSLPLYAQGKFKVAFVDLAKIIQEAEAAKDAKDKLQAEYKKKQEELKKMQDEILKLQDDVVQKSKFMSQQELDKKKSEIEKKQSDFLSKLREAEAEIQQLDSKLTQEVLEDVRKIISDIAEKDNYDLVLEKSQILYVRDADDITFRVIDIYNREWRGKKNQRQQTPPQQQKKK